MSSNDYYYEFDAPEVEMEVIHGLNDFCRRHSEEMAKNGFSTNELGTDLMLITSELGEALEADRIDRYASQETVDMLFESFDIGAFKIIKDSFEDEIADAFLRLAHLIGSRGIDIEKHIALKQAYNRTRTYKHSKKY